MKLSNLFKRRKSKNIHTVQYGIRLENCKECSYFDVEFNAYRKEIVRLNKVIKEKDEFLNKVIEIMSHSNITNVAEEDLPQFIEDIKRQASLK